MNEREIGEILGTIKPMNERFNHLEQRFNHFENRVETRFNHLLLIIITMWVTLGGLMLGMLIKGAS